MNSFFPWLSPLCVCGAALIPWVAPSCPAGDGATYYSKGLSKAALRNFHTLQALLLGLSSLCSAFALFGASGAPPDALYLAASALAAGYLYGCSTTPTPSSDATAYLLALAAAAQLAGAGGPATQARAGVAATLVLASAAGLAMSLLGARQAPAPPPTLHPSDAAPFLSRLAFLWVSPLMLLGASRPLVASDLSPPPAHITSACVAEHLRAAAAALPPGAPFLSLLLRAWLPLFLSTTVFKLTFDVAQVAGPLILQQLIAWMEATTAAAAAAAAGSSSAAPAPPQSQGLAYVALFLATSCLQTLLLHQYFTRSFRLGMLLRTSAVLCVVDKTLRLSTHQQPSTAEGSSAAAAAAAVAAGTAATPPPAAAVAAAGPTAVVSTIASDSKRLQDVSTYLCSIISAPWQIALYTFLLWQQLGVAVLAGIAVMLASLPLNGYLASWGEQLQVRMMTARDARVAATGEALGAIRLLKTNAWEAPFLQGIQALRNAELAQLHVYRLVAGLGEVTWLGVPVLVAVASFSTYVLAGGVLTPSRVFTSLALLNLLRFPLTMLPSVISSLIEASVSVRRIQAFLSSAEVQQGAVTRVGEGGGGSSSADSTGSSSVSISSGSSAEAAAADTSVLALSVAEEQQQQQQALAVSAPPLPSTAAMVMEAAVFSWCAPPSTPTPSPATPATPATPASTPAPLFLLGPLTLTLPRGALIAIVGPSGSGKTALMNAVLGELHLRSGAVRARAGEAFLYAPQTPCILNASVADNITYGLPLLGAPFAAALAQACLGPDLALMAAGAQTEIGEKGINLSGGQKARVGLCRAFYAAALAAADTTPDSSSSRGVTLVLDDPLSAVDAHVASALFRSLRGGAPGSALAGCTRLLVTHSLGVVERCDYVVVLGRGGVVQAGTPAECLAAGGQGGGEGGSPLLADMLAGYQGTSRELRRAWDEAQEEEGQAPAAAAAAEEGEGQAALAEAVLAPPAVPAEPAVPIPSPTAAAQAASPTSPTSPTSSSSSSSGQLVAAETLNRGAVAWRVALTYLRACGGPTPAATLLLCFSAFYALSIGSTFWLSYWSSLSSTPASPLSLELGLGVYSALSLASIALLFLQLALWVRATLAGAAALHAALLGKLLTLPASFYDTTPSGRLLSRVSADMAAIDGPLPEALHSALSTAFSVAASLLTAVLAMPYFALVLPPLLYAYRALQLYYTATSRELQRLDSISRSPLFSHLTELLQGLACVRAYGAAPAAAAKAAALLDANWRAYCSTVAANRWLAVRVESLSAGLTAGAALVAVLMAPGGGPTFASSAGLAVSTIMGMSQYLNWMVRMLSEAETALVAVERVAEYAELPGEGEGEAANSASATPPPASWPSFGAITITNLRLRYRVDTPEVLRGLTLTIPPGARVGIVGRTGAGKSSLIAALLRTADVQSGSIVLDGLDTGTLPRGAVRAAISYVPQEAVLFTGSVRKNLDVLGVHGGEDGRLWAALAAVGLVEGEEGGGSAGSCQPRRRIESLDGTQVGEGGANFSVGERQLICIARAMLKRARVVVMDEATASVDAAGDERVQAALRTSFKGVTQLVVAHRINTVLDSDYILVMEGGQVGEWGTPEELTRKEGGLFRALVAESARK